MDYIKKINSKEIQNHLPDHYSFICFASFEERCFSVPQSIKPESINKSYVFYNSDPQMTPKTKPHLDEICDKIGGISAVSVNLNKPVEVADTLFKTIQEILVNGETNLAIDITSFTHETLLILISSLHRYKERFESIVLLYNGASEYSTWLSKGCKEARNVIGYPGLLKPSLKYHLVILTGFEHERATRLVELLEPDLLSLGNGVEPTNHNHTATMDVVREEFSTWAKNLQGLQSDSFEFSCSNIQSTIETLRKIINNNPDHNFILVPLNTKLSTISVAMVALQNKRIQVCYPLPEVYNTIYSRPSENITIVELNKIKEFYQ